uniref:Uncharacterized protein n=1 Tax=Hyaloperonospora arabidopsidis (strain Emoy2) TaxID=559515 RepID=M4BSK2_HYAAE
MIAGKCNYPRQISSKTRFSPRLIDRFKGNRRRSLLKRIPCTQSGQAEAATGHERKG